MRGKWSCWDKWGQATSYCIWSVEKDGQVRERAQWPLWLRCVLFRRWLEALLLVLFPQNPSWLAPGSHSVNLCWINEQTLISHLQRGKKQKNSVAGELPSDTGVGWVWVLLHLLRHHFEKWIFLPWYRLKKSFHCRIWFCLLIVIVFYFLKIFTWFEIQKVGKRCTVETLVYRSHPAPFRGDSQCDQFLMYSTSYPVHIQENM